MTMTQNLTRHRILQNSDNTVQNSEVKTEQIPKQVNHHVEETEQAPKQVNHHVEETEQTPKQVNHHVEKNVGIYVHVPYCKSKCAYCAFVSGSDCTTQAIYLSALTQEIVARAQGETADTLYVGGGTPSMLHRGALSQIVRTLEKSFHISTNAERTVEANPDSCTLDFLKESRDVGFNRLSLGLQSIDDQLLKAVNRPHRFADFLRAFESAKKIGYQNISVDLMMGLPHETKAGYERTLNAVLSLKPHHLSVYALKVEEGTPLYESGFVPDEDFQADLYDLTVKLAQQNGLMRYEVSNFALQGKQSRHNQKYWSRAPYFGFGPAAHSFIQNERIENTSNTAVYNTGKWLLSGQRIDRDEAIEETLMLALRTREGLSFQTLKTCFNYDFALEKAAQISELLSMGLLCKTDNGIRLAEDAYYVMNAVLLKLL